jgi:nucleotide-binding universal stress UspA family protein
VVVGVDGSESGNRALLWAAEQAALEKRDLTLVHVTKPVSTSEMGWMISAQVPIDEVRDAQVAEGRDLLDEAKERVAWKTSAVAVHTALTVGDARQVLLDLSRDAHLLVLGSRGRGPVKSLLLGSVSVAISRYAACPVVVVRPHHPGAVRRGVLVGTDGSDQTHGTLEFAYRQASLRKLPLTVLYCVWNLPDLDAPRGMVPDDAPGLEEHRLVLAESVSGMSEKFPDVHVRLRIGHGLADDCLADASRTMDLVVVGRHGSSSADGVGLGSFAPTVVEHSAGPVAVVGSTSPARAART